MHRPFYISIYITEKDNRLHCFSINAESCSESIFSVLCIVLRYRRLSRHFTGSPSKCLYGWQTRKKRTKDKRCYSYPVIPHQFIFSANLILKHPCQILFHPQTVRYKKAVMRILEQKCEISVKSKRKKRIVSPRYSINLRKIKQVGLNLSSCQCIMYFQWRVILCFYNTTAIMPFIYREMFV